MNWYIVSQGGFVGSFDAVQLWVHDKNDLRSLILIWITPVECNLYFKLRTTWQYNVKNANYTAWEMIHVQIQSIVLKGICFSGLLFLFQELSRSLNSCQIIIFIKNYFTFVGFFSFFNFFNSNLILFLTSFVFLLFCLLSFLLSCYYLFFFCKINVIFKCSGGKLLTPNPTCIMYI